MAKYPSFNLIQDFVYLLVTCRFFQNDASNYDYSIQYLDNDVQLILKDIELRIVFNLLYRNLSRWNEENLRQESLCASRIYEFVCPRVRLNALKKTKFPAFAGNGAPAN